jgi:hypothetical protein
VISLAVLTAVIVAAITASVLIAIRSRNQSPKSKDRFNWEMPLYAALFACLIFLPMMLSDSWDMDSFLYLLIAVPVVSLVLLLNSGHSQEAAFIGILGIACLSGGHRYVASGFSRATASAEMVAVVTSIQS